MGYIKGFELRARTRTRSSHSEAACGVASRRIIDRDTIGSWTSNFYLLSRKACIPIVISRCDSSSRGDLQAVSIRLANTAIHIAKYNTILEATVAAYRSRSTIYAYGDSSPIVPWSKWGHYWILLCTRQSVAEFPIVSNSKWWRHTGWSRRCEIEYLSRKKSLTINNSSSGSNRSAKVKIQTNLSVAHFSYFNKLLMQAKVLSHDNNSEFFRFIADNYKTKATENISSDSFKTKYHNVEESTIIATRRLLIKLYNLAK